MPTMSAAHQDHGPPRSRISSCTAARDIAVTVLWVSLVLAFLAQLIE